MTNKFIILSVEMVHKFLPVPKPIKLCTLNRNGLVYVNYMSIKLFQKTHWAPTLSFLNLKFIILFSVTVFDFTYETVSWFYQIS